MLCLNLNKKENVKKEILKKRYSDNGAPNIPK